jgi:hypothetical protein
MADLRIEGSELTLAFTPLERAGALRPDPRVPLHQVRAVDVVQQPWSILRGLRVGTALPWVILLGTMLRRGGNDVVAVNGRGPAVVVHLDPATGWQRWICTLPDPADVCARIQAALPQS